MGTGICWCKGKCIVNRSDNRRRYELNGSCFSSIQFFPFMLELVGMHGCMWFFAGSTLIGVFFVYFCIPETKGKSIEAIVEQLEAK
jgi:hypothetical protein